MDTWVICYDKLGMGDVDTVGGKNASLGEMISHLSTAGVSVPNGFATTAEAFRKFLAQNGLQDKINNLLDELDIDDVRALAQTGKAIRSLIAETEFPAGARSSAPGHKSLPAPPGNPG